MAILFQTIYLSILRSFILMKEGAKMSHNELDILREKVDTLNLQLLELINERAKAAQEIGKIKRKTRYVPF